MVRDDYKKGYVDAVNKVAKMVTFAKNGCAGKPVTEVLNSLRNDILELKKGNRKR
jgi:Zn/Cd-binding protein ZinT